MNKTDFVIGTVFENSISKKWNKRFFYVGTDRKEKFLIVLEDNVYLPHAFSGKYTFFGNMTYSQRNQIMKLTVSHYEPYVETTAEESRNKIRAILGIA